ncbi:hypothetical protein WA1_50275 [Scytonema hofmannii PCC 7110]|uniref:Uncharacterized protein n=1 Tax=Scytonema hofmannii PCC 7110 TaxID=128403 RepID=A0A139WR55_9CYAN|nr:hypothetical protein [Scytonema hofmannii]KYC34914.1 hypothetical protein WA1_50275 [Scytonema hofmannii PCC 7110]
MAMFFDGATDSLIASVLNSIEWEIRYNLLSGKCPDSPAFRQAIPGTILEDGTYLSEGCFSITSSIIAGSQKTTISWHTKNGEVHFYIDEITPKKD